jgi:hypothetical protein
MIKNITTSGLLLAVILFLFACDDPNKLGLDLQRDDQRISTFVTDTFTIETSMKLVDTLNTTVNSTTGRGLLGAINDSQWGRINAMSFGSFLLPTSGVKFTDDQNRAAVMDSVALQLFISNTYGDTSQFVTIRVHRLSQPMQSSKNNYFSRDNLPIGELLGSVRRKVKTGNTIAIRLDDKLAQEFLSREGTDDLRVQANFDQFMKGLRISVEGANNFMFSFDPNDTGSNTKLIFYYKNPPETTQRTPAIFFTGSNGAGILFSNIQYDLSQTQNLRNLATNGTLTPSSRTNNQCYTIGGIGLVTLIKFPSVYGFSKNRDIIVNRAELIIEPTPDNFTTSILNPTFPNLQFVLATPDGQFDRYTTGVFTGQLRFVLSEGAVDPRNILIMNYLSSGRTYQPAIFTSYVQALMNQIADNNGIFIRTDRLFSSPEGISFWDNKARQNRMRLLVYYTKVQR